MARKGSRKVRTGCLTCKIRKVKCDEGKPHCHRCTSTGRKCDGYGPPPPQLPSLRWHRPRSSFPGAGSAAETRRLQFFWEVAAPGMSGPTDPYFWTSMVLQFGSFEPAVRHSIVAVSALYERLLRDPSAAGRLPSSDDNDDDDGAALRHYNAAIREVRAADSAPLVLLVCVLFVCVEFLRGRRGAAIEHCKHGARLLEAVAPACAWAREFLEPVFRRLSLFPFFFGGGSFPRLVGVDDPVPPAFASVAEAQFHADNAVRRAVRLLRSADAYRLGHLRRDAAPGGLLAEQGAVRAMLRAWHASFLAFEAEARAGAETRGLRGETVSHILMRYEISRIWAELALERDEMAYDYCMDRFRWLTDEAAKVASSRAVGGQGSRRNSPVFSFEMGFVPSLLFIVMKCRCLDTRVRALSLVKRLGAARETLWEVGTVYATGKLIIELEHGVLLDQSGRPCTESVCSGFPDDGARVREITTDPNTRVRVDPITGREEVGRMLGLFMKSADDGIYLRSEFIVETP